MWETLTQRQDAIRNKPETQISSERQKPHRGTFVFVSMLLKILSISNEIFANDTFSLHHSKYLYSAINTYIQ